MPGGGRGGEERRGEGRGVADLRRDLLDNGEDLERNPVFEGF